MNRRQRLDALRRTRPFDLLVIGGGATGCGIACDAASRGLAVALIERDDLAQGTGGPGSQLIEGGMRKFAMAGTQLERAPYPRVKACLDERAAFMRNAPHLVESVALVTPIYRWLEVPGVYAALRFHDALAGRRGIGRDQLVGRAETRQRYPTLKPDRLKAGVVYFDAQFDGARLALTLALSAQQNDAVVANHVELMEFVKEAGEIRGARVRDAIDGAQFTIRAHGVINACDSFVDRLRQLDDPAATPIVDTRTSFHIVLGRRFAPPDAGLMIPKNDDGSGFFILPWQGQALIGTSRAASGSFAVPAVGEDEIASLLHRVNRHVDIAVTRADVKAAWSSPRPSVRAAAATDARRLEHEHLIDVSASGLLTVVGGQWTSYRRIAEETVDCARQTFLLGPARACYTRAYRLFGGENFDPAGEAGLIADYDLPADVAHRLHHAYGDQAPRVAELARGGLAARLLPDHPFI